MPTTVLIVDDHPGFRRSARKMLETDGYEVVGEAEDGRSALSQLSALRPQLVLLDVVLPDADGFELAERLAVLDPAAAIVLVSSHDRSDFGPLVTRCSVRGFLPKDELSGAALTELLA